MKKTWIAVIALMTALLMLCSACGGKDETEDPEATELPFATRPPEDGEDTQTMKDADDNKAPGSLGQTDRLASMSEDQKKAEALFGRSVDELYKALGKPSKTEYSASCLVADGKDGMLDYGDFYVMTTRWSDGRELVMGTMSK